jgi:hypothetical protein
MGFILRVRTTVRHVPYSVTAFVREVDVLRASHIGESPLEVGGPRRTVCSWSVTHRLTTGRAAGAMPGRRWKHQTFQNQSRNLRRNAAFFRFRLDLPSIRINPSRNLQKLASV